MGNFYMSLEDPKNVKAKRTKAGYINPRYKAALDGTKERKKEHKELAHTWRRLTKEEIQAIYTQEYIEQLAAKAAENLKNITQVVHITAPKELQRYELSELF